MTTGTFNVSNNVVTTSSPVEVGVAPAPGGSFTPLLLLQSGVEFNSTDTTGTFSTPPMGGSGGVVSAYAAGTTVPLLNAQAINFEAPALLSSSSYYVLSGTGTNSAELGVAGGGLSVTALRFNGSSELDVQGNLSFSDFAGLTLGVGGSNYVALTSSGVSLTGLSVTIPGPTSFAEAGLDFTATNLQVTYSSSNNEFDLSGSATLTDAGNTFDLTLGSTSDPGLVIENGSLASLDATVSGSFAFGDLTISAEDLTIDASAGSTVTITGSASVDLGVAGNSEMLGLALGTTESGVTAPGLVIDQSSGDLVSFDAFVSTGLAIGGLGITSDGLELDYDSTNDDFSVSGAASFTVDNSTVSMSLAAPSTNTPAGLLIEDGQLLRLDATLSSNASISVAGTSVAVPSLSVEYQSANGGSLDISGSASFTVAGEMVDLTLGNGTTPGLAISGGTVQSLDATLSSNASISVAGTTVTLSGLTVDYQAANDDSLAISGSASFTVAGEMVDLTLGNGTTPGLAISGGTVQSLDATLSSNASISVAGTTVTLSGLTVDYQAANDDSLDISGSASISLPNSTVSIMLGTSTTPGLMISGGVVQSLDASVKSNFTVAGLTIDINTLTVEYESSGNDLAIFGTATFELAGSPVSISLAQPSGNSQGGGLVIQNGNLESLDASITGHFNLLGINIVANGLGIDYVASAEGTSTEFAIFGGVSITSSFLNFSAMLGNQQQPGLVIDQGSLQSLNIAVSGGFSLFGFQVQANGLAIQYPSSNGDLELSGGIMLDFTSAFEVSAGISQGGLFINPQTEALSIPSTGLQITASATLGAFSIQNLMISFSNGPSGVNFSASGAVDLPGGIDVDLTQLVVQNGQLDDIGISVTAPIPIGDTGFFIDSLSGSLDNLNNVSQLVVSASAQISFGDPIPVPSLGPIFAGGNFYLVEATGSITVSASELDLSGSVSLLGGLLGQGSASLDLDWATGVYSVSGNFSMYDGIFDFGGSLTITSSGDITLVAMASVNVPPQIPFIGGDSLGSVNFLLQYQVGGDSSQDIAAAWTTFSILSYSFTIGFEVEFNGNVSVIDGNDVAGLIAGAQKQTQPTQYVYQSQFQVPGTELAGTAPTGEQISVTSPILDGDYPVSLESQSASALFASSGQSIYTTAYLPNSYIEMSTLDFTVMVEGSEGSFTIGYGSFNSQGQLVFTPNGTQGIVPTSAFLSSSGALDLSWPAVPYDATQVTISANYNVEDAYFELLEQGSGGSNTVVGTYTIDPVDNDPYDPVQTAQQANLVVPQTAVNGIYRSLNNQEQTVYTLAEGQAVPQTVSFSLYSGTVATGGTLLGTGTFNASGSLVFVPNGHPSIVPISGSLGVDGGTPQGYIALSLSQPTASTYITVTYATIANRVIDFQLPSSQSSSSSPAQYTIELVDNTPTPLSTNNPDEVPNFTETTLYQTPTVSFASGSVALSSSGILSGTVLANAYTPQAVDGSSSTSVSIYYNTTDSTTGGTLIDTSTYNPNSANSSGTTSYPFSFPGFANLPAGSYYLYAIINDGQNAPVSSSVAGPFTEASPTPVLSGPSYLPLSESNGVEEGFFSAADNTALRVTTNFVTPVNVNLSVSGGGTLILSGGSSGSQISKTYSTAAAAVTALNGLMFASNSSFTGASTLTFAVSTTINGTTYSASNSIALLTPNTPLEVTQTVDSTVPSDPSQFNVMVTVTNNPNGPDAQNGTEVQVAEALSSGLTVVSATPSEGTFNGTNGVWTIGNLPLTGANSATLALVIQAAPTAQGQSLTSSAMASSALFNYPASSAASLVAVKRPQPITFTVSNLSDSGTGSLRNALEYAENGDTITFSPGLSGTINLTSGELLINQDVTIIGPTTAAGAATVEISGGQSSRVFDIEGGTAGVDVTLENLEIENGLANAASPNVASAGGGLLINDAGGTVGMSNVLLSGNVAQGTTTAPAQGGGIAFVGGTGTFSDITFANNQATAAAGGTASGGALAITAGNVTLLTGTIADNTAAGGTTSSGGGIGVSGASSLTLSNDTVADNTAGVGGDIAQTAPAFVESLNSVFASSSTMATDPDFAGTVAFSDHNLVDNTAGSTGFSAATGDLLNINAALAPLGNNGGPLPTMPPLPGSPLINAGDTGISTGPIPGLVSLIGVEQTTQASSSLLGQSGAQGTVQDLTGNDSGVTNSAVTIGPGVIGEAIQFNGTTSAVTVADTSSLDTADFTIGGWFNISAAPAPGTTVVLAQKSNGGGNGWTLSLGSNLEPSFSLSSSSSSASATSSQALGLDTWYYITGTFNGTTATLYINGTAVGTATLSGGYATSTSPLMLGAAPTNPTDFYAGQGNALDSAGTNSGTIVGNVGYQAGSAGQAFDFSGGEGNYIALGAGPDIVGTGAFAIAVWVNTTSTGTEYIINQRDPNNANGEYVLQLNDGQANFWTNANNTFGFNITTGETVNNGNWHLIVAERLANGTGEIFIDGVLAASSGVPSTVTNMESGIKVYIGEDVRDAVDVGPGYGFNFDGLIEAVQIYSTALTPTQIATLQTSLPAQIAGDTTLTVDNFAGAIDDFAFYNTALSPVQVRGLAVTQTAATELATTNNLMDFYAGQGNALDSAGTNNGTIVGNISYATGVAGQALNFASANSYIALGTAPDIVGTGAFAIAVWVNTTSTGTEYIINQRDPNSANGEYVLQLNNGQVNSGRTPTTLSVSTSPPARRSTTATGT